MAPIEKSHFSTNDLPVAQRRETWRQGIATLFDVEPSPSEPEDRFNAELTSYLMDERVMLARCQTTAQRFLRKPLRIAQDGLDHYLIQTHLEGSQCIQRGMQRQSNAPGDLLVIDLAAEHAAETTEFTNLTLVVPRPMLAPHLAAPDSQQGRVLPGHQGLVKLAVSHLRMLWATVEELTPAASQEAIEPTLRLIASALNGSDERVEGGPDATAQSLLAQARIRIERDLHRELSVRELCGSLGISRATLYRLFEPLGGVRAYIQERRLQGSARALKCPEQAHLGIFEIALSWGFTSHAHFSRAFKQRFGLSPTRARESAGAPVNGATMPPKEIGGDRNFEFWIERTLKLEPGLGGGVPATDAAVSG